MATGRFLDAAITAVGSVGVSTILDAGCGEGFLACRIDEKRYLGMDISPKPLQVAKQTSPGKPLAMGDICRMPFRDGSFDLVIACEVLEHLERPEKALAEAARVSKRYCMFSVPREPYFMLMDLLRGKNIGRLGNDIEHVQHWTGKGFKEYLSGHFDVLAVWSPFPWTIVLCEKRKT